MKWHLVENKKFWASNFLFLPSFRQQFALTDLKNRLFLSQFDFRPARVKNKGNKWYFSLQNVISSLLVKMKNYRPHKPYLLFILVIWCSSQVLLSFKPMIFITFELHAAKNFHFMCELLDRKRQKVFSWAQITSLLPKNRFLPLTFITDQDPLVFGLIRSPI